MFYPCLVLDHDDTVVNSTATVHHPCFVQFMKEYFPHINIGLEEYFRLNFDPGVVALFRDIVGMTPEQVKFEQAYWYEYVQHHIPQAYDDFREILNEQKARGGKICVVSHSYSQNILRDYRENGLPEPDMVFGWECPAEERKPSPHALYEIMKAYHLKPEELLMLDDLKPGYEMAKAASVPFAAAGWSNDIPEIETFMRKNCDLYFKTVSEFKQYLFGKDK